MYMVIYVYIWLFIVMYVYRNSGKPLSLRTHEHQQRNSLFSEQLEGGNNW